MVEDDGAVLRAGVGALPVQRRRVVRGEEDVEEVAVADDVGVEVDLDDFGVAGAPGADGVVRRVLDVAAHVAGDDAVDAAQRLHDGFDAPEAAAAEGGRGEIGHGNGLGWGKCSFQRAILSEAPASLRSTPPA